MKIKEMREVIRIKNGILVKQTRRIELLEEKMAELRKIFPTQVCRPRLPSKGCGVNITFYETESSHYMFRNY
jgi:hypothetical protein